MPNFTKTIDQLETQFDRWMFAIKNLSRLNDKPSELRDAVFEAFFDAAKISAFDNDERFKYEKSLKYYRDMNNVIETAKEEGYDVGHEEAMQEATQVIRITEAKLKDAQKREEEAQKREEEAQKREEEAQKREEEAQKREEEERTQKDADRQHAIQTLADKLGISIEEAAGILGFDN